jgi:hypothetical protein
MVAVSSGGAGLSVMSLGQRTYDARRGQNVTVEHDKWLSGATRRARSAIPAERVVCLGPKALFRDRTRRYVRPAPPARAWGPTVEAQRPTEYPCVLARGVLRHG